MPDQVVIPDAPAVEAIRGEQQEAEGVQNWRPEPRAV